MSAVPASEDPRSQGDLYEDTDDTRQNEVDVDEGYDGDDEKNQSNKVGGQNSKTMRRKGEPTKDVRNTPTDTPADTIKSRPVQNPAQKVPVTDTTVATTERTTGTTNGNNMDCLQEVENFKP